jgi:CheY-like chemotaxis protein
VAKILIIDDDALIRAGISGLVESDGHTTVLATNGREGEDLFRASRFDMVICDIVMDEQDGIETIIKMRRIDPVTPILAVSGSADGGDRWLKFAQRLGATEILAKPFTGPQLLAKVADCLALSQRSANQSEPPAALARRSGS